MPPGDLGLWEFALRQLLDKLPCVVAILGFAWMAFGYLRHRDSMDERNRERTAQSFKDQDASYSELLKEAYRAGDRRGRD